MVSPTGTTFAAISTLIEKSPPFGISVCGKFFDQIFLKHFRKYSLKHISKNQWLFRNIQSTTTQFPDNQVRRIRQ